MFGASLFAGLAYAQETELPPKDGPKSEPSYDDTFSGPIVEVTATKITVSRSILGKPAEKRTFLDQVRHAHRRQVCEFARK